MKSLIILAIAVSSISGFTIDLPLHTVVYRFEEYQGFDRLCVDGPCVHPFEPGMPDLPAVVYSYVLPRDEIVTSISIQGISWQELSGDFRVYPKQRDVAMVEERVFTPIDPVIYTSHAHFPKDPVLSFDCGTMRGYRILQITVVPFSYIPVTGQVFHLERLTLSVHTRTAEIPPAPIRESDISHQMFLDLVSKVVVNGHDLASERCCPAISVTTVDGDSVPTDLPSLLGPPVDLVIITDVAQAAAYGQFVHRKKQMGLNTVVRTIPWIRQHYQGVDDAERIRNFLKDAMVQWGTSFVILGGDHDFVPTRFVWIDRSVIYTQLWLPIASDHYYSDLDGSWNFDGDHKFGEVEDSLDLYADVFIGRIPTRHSDDVLAYMEKVLTYIFPSNTSYQEKALFFSSNLETNWPGLPYAYEMSQHIPSFFSRSFLDETLGNLSLESLRDSLNAGFGLVGGVGHGDVNIMCIRFAWPRVYIDNYFFDALHNGLISGLLLVVTCYTNPFPSNCLGEHWVRNPDGGGIAYVGPTSSSEGSIHKEYMKCVLDSTFCAPLGMALSYGKVFYVGNAQWNNWHRVHQLSITLLGDPTVSVWGRKPIDLAPVTVVPETLNVGYDTITITYDPHVKPKRVAAVFYKHNDTYTRDSSVTNLFITPIKSVSCGYLTFTLIADDHIPYQDSIYIAPSGPFCRYAGSMVIDSAHNGNGVINPGETIWLDVQVMNAGGSIATGVSARLSTADTFVTMVKDSTTFPNVPPGQSVENTAPFELTVGQNLPDDYGLNFNLVIDYSGTSTEDTFQIIAQAAQLVYFKNTFTVYGDTLVLSPLVANYGHASAHAVTARLRALTDSITISDSTVVFSTIAPNQIAGCDPDDFAIVRTYGNCSVRMEVHLYENGTERCVHPITYQAVPAVDSLLVYGSKNTIRLRWQNLSGICGYRVYRALQYNGPYSFLGNNLEPIAHFEDFSVQPAVDYHYYVQAVDSSMNQGICCDTVCMQVNPTYAPGWPQDVYGLTYGSPNFGDIDPYYPGLEIVSAGLDGCIYAFHCDGTPVNGTDPRLFDSGSDYIWGSPAIGDIDEDGSLEIVFGVMRGTNNLYAIRYDPLGNQVTIVPGWPKTCKGGGFASSPVLADLDHDDDLEIVALSSFPAYLYVFHHDGSAVFHNRTGLLKKLYGNILGTPAVGDCDGDGSLEIVCCGGHQGDSLFVWDNTGQYKDPFPVQSTMGQGHSVVLGDVCGGPDPEICFYAGGPSYRLILMNTEGMILWQYPALAEYIELAPAFGDITGDGRAEVIFSYNDGLDAGVMAFDSTGALLPGYPVREHDAFPPAIVDIDNSGTCDIVCGSTEWNLYAYSTAGTMVPGYPIKLGNRINSTPAVYDIDQDGSLELMVSCYDLAFHVFDLDATTFQWPRFHYDPYNSGCYLSGYYGKEETSVHTPEMSYRARVFPSPFTRRCVIQWYGSSLSAGTRLVVAIYDITGRLVYEFKDIPADQCQTIVWSGIDIRGRAVPCGVYFLKIEHAGQQFVHKVVKIK
ncbi:T9SS type A sorting domain-containing protein [candidate division WOR-3 bacterium]|nr:T9SS type A sorting domain-containing protein [candidate division WOR-3 bacterium]